LEIGHYFGLQTTITCGQLAQKPQMKTQLILAPICALIAFGPVAAFGAEKTKASKTKPYPLQTCIVSDEKIGEHGKPYVFTHEGQELKLCCKPCLKDFKKDPAKYLKKLADNKKS
jgi:hypothetical protein